VRISILALALLLAGCAPTIRQGAPMINQADIPAQLTQSKAIILTQDHRLPEMWWQRFHDKELDRFIALALSNNPGLQEAEDRVQMAQAVLSESESLNLPHIDSQAQILRQKSSKLGNHDIYNGKTASVSNINPLTINYHLDIWHRDSEIIAASQDDVQKQLSQAQQSALLLSASVIKTYCALNTAKKMITVQQDVVQSVQNEWILRQSAYQAGIQSRSPQLKQHAVVLHEQEALAGLQKHAEALQFALLELLGKSANLNDKIATAPIHVPEHFALPQHIDFDLLAQRPDIQAALWNIKQWKHLEKVAQLSFYPNININALVGFNIIGLHQMLGADAFQYAAGPAIDLPLFEGGALEARLHRNEAGYDLAVHTYNRTILSAVRQIADALSSLQYTQTQLDESNDTLTIRRDTMQIAQNAYATGIDGKFPYLESLIEMDHTKLHDMEENLAWLNDITDAATALGGGFGGAQS